MSTIGDRTRSFDGRTIARRKSWRAVRPRSDFERRAVLPVSFRRRAAFHCSSTAALVSRRKKIDMVRNTPAYAENRQQLDNNRDRALLTRIVIIQKVHRQPTDSETKPPIIGPKTLQHRQYRAALHGMMPLTGPNSGPKKNKDIALPRCAGGMTSATVPPPTVKGPDAAHPASHRKARNMPVFVLSAQPMVKPT